MIDTSCFGAGTPSNFLRFWAFLFLRPLKLICGNLGTPFLSVENARTAGVCGCAGTLATPALSPASFHPLAHWRSTGAQRLALLGWVRCCRSGVRGTQGRSGVTAVVFRLPSEDTSTLRVQLQLMKLSLVERIHRRPHRQDRVEVVAIPLHSALVEVAAGLRSKDRKSVV